MDISAGGIFRLTTPSRVESPLLPILQVGVVLQNEVR